MTKKGNLEILPEEIYIFHQFAWKSRNFSSICLEKSKIFPGKIEIFQKFAWKNQFFLPGSTTPRFQTRLTPLIPLSHDLLFCLIPQNLCAILFLYLAGIKRVRDRDLGSL